MPEAEEHILDLPDHEQLPKPKMFFGVFMAGAATMIVGSIFKISHWPGTFIILMTAWALLVLHFILKCSYNFKNYRMMCMRDLGRLLVISGVMMKVINLPFALACLLVGGVLYAVGYFAVWK